jgi:hypothetical protein
MKKIIIKSAFLLMLFSGVLTSCVQDDDTDIPVLKVPFYSEQFQDPQYIQDGSVFDLPGWTNFAEEGNLLWSEQIYSGDGYAEFNSYGTGDASDIAWLVSPSIDISEYPGAKFAFTSAQNYVTSDANKVECYVSTDYNGTDVLAATWTKVDANFANSSTLGYLFVPSGEIDLAPYEAAGHIYIAFRAIGSGTTNSALDGLFQINDLYVYTISN